MRTNSNEEAPRPDHGHNRARVAGADRVDGRKKIEYRQIKPYWTKRFAKVSLPVEPRLLNGMNPPVPEVTALIDRITKDRRAREYRLHIKRVLGYKHWDNRGGRSRNGDDLVVAALLPSRRSPTVPRVPPSRIRRRE